MVHHSLLQHVCLFEGLFEGKCVWERVKLRNVPLSPPAGLSVLSSSLSIEFSCCSSFRLSVRRWSAEFSTFCCLWEHRLSARLLQTRFKTQTTKDNVVLWCVGKLKHLEYKCPVWIKLPNRTQILAVHVSNLHPPRMFKGKVSAFVCYFW